MRRHNTALIAALLALGATGDSYPKQGKPKSITPLSEKALTGKRRTALEKRERRAARNLALAEKQSGK